MSVHSFSSTDAYQRCPQRYKYAYLDRIEPVNHSVVSPMSFGSAVHAGLEMALKFHYYYGAEELSIKQAAFESCIANFFTRYYTDNMAGASDDPLFGSMCEQARAITVRTVAHLHLFADYEVVAVDGIPLVEYEGEYQSFRYHIDAVLRDTRTQAVYLIDWKCRAKLLPDGEDYAAPDEMNSQIKAYFYLLRAAGVQVSANIIYQILPLLPARPAINKDGTISRAGITSDWETYKSVVVEQGLDPDDYLDMRSRLEEKIFFRPVFLYFGHDEVDRSWASLMQWVARAGQDTTYPRVLNTACKWCPYSKLCAAWLRGYDEKVLIATDFKVKLDNR